MISGQRCRVRVDVLRRGRRHDAVALACVYIMGRRHPQERQLRPLDEKVALTRGVLIRDVVHASRVNERTCPIPFTDFAVSAPWCRSKGKRTPWEGTSGGQRQRVTSCTSVQASVRVRGTAPSRRARVPGAPRCPRIHSFLLLKAGTWETCRSIGGGEPAPLLLPPRGGCTEDELLRTVCSLTVESLLCEAGKPRQWLGSPRCVRHRCFFTGCDDVRAA